MSVFLSIIIPVYNAAPYLKKCLDSVWEQDLPEDRYEVILVNDGSTDESPAIAAALLSAHTNGTMVSQANSGLAVTRNVGIGLAKGEYIWFVDSDDWISSNCLAEMLASVKGEDILAFGAVSHMPGKDRYITHTSEGILTGEEYLCRYRDKIEACSPFYLFKRKLLTDNNFSFFPGIFHEDNEFTPRVLYKASGVVVSGNVYYHRLVHPGSIMTTISPKRPTDMVTGMRSLHSFVSGQGCKGKVRTALYDIIAACLNYSCKMANSLPEENQKALDKLYAGEQWITPVLLGSGRFRFKLEGALLALFPGRFRQIHLFLMRFKPRIKPLSGR